MISIILMPMFKSSLGILVSYPLYEEEAFSIRKEFLTKSLKKQTKIKIMKTLVWTTLLYGSETWTLRKEDIQKFEALEMWLWRRIEKISWTDKVTNEDVHRRAGIERQLIYM